jgi:hypothetical protein
MNSIKWIVLEEDPKPDTYIAIMATASDRKLGLERKACSIYASCEKAMERARELREFYKVKSIRLFQQDGLSAIL